MLEILICDDEQIWIDNLVKSINEVLNVEYNLHTFINPDDLLEYLSKNSADIVFIDIQLPKTSGIEVAKRIYSHNKTIQFVFTSVSNNYIQEVFEVKPVHYLIKPFDNNYVAQALSIANNNLCKYKQSIRIISNGKMVNLLVNEIQYVESDKRIVNFHHNGTIIPSLMKLDDVEAKLPNNFVRSHQSYLVNANEIKRISNNEIELQSGQVLPVAKSRFATTKRQVKEYWNSNQKN